MPTIKNFGKAWQLTVTTAADANNSQTIISTGSDSWTPEPLEIEFDVIQTISNEFSGYWVAFISIYNLNPQTTQQILKQGSLINLQAGYQNKIGYGTIFEGTLYQSTWERIDGINTKLTLHCITGLVENSSNFVSYNTAAGLTQLQIVSRMASASNIAYPLDVSNVVLPNPTKTTRGNVYFGQPSDILQPIAKANVSNLWFTQGAANIRQLVDATAVPTFQIGTANVIGTPQQNQDGVLIRINLDARAILRGQVQLSPDVNIKQVDRFQGSLPVALDVNGIYAIARINHVGNSRSNLWDTNITGATSLGSRLGLQNP